MLFNQTCLGACNPPQIININTPLTNIDNIIVYDGCGCPYDLNSMQFAYSLDGVCWSCYLSHDDAIASIVSLNQDFFVRIRVQGLVNGIAIDCQDFTDYSTSLESGFNFTYCDTSYSSNLYNPYINLEGAISLQQYLTEAVNCMFGIPIYYFKLSPNAGSKDLTFKEYTLLDVEAVKQIKLIIPDGTMPSSKPEFSDFGLDWQTDWETEISKASFATAFGSTAQPMEGDLIYIPMMKRMWMVNEAYEEKNGNLMWKATTFKVALVKYQEKGSVDLGTTEEMINSFVKNKYEDLFGDQENLASGEEQPTDRYIANNLYPVYESDATRKFATVDSIDIVSDSTYYRGTLISDMFYDMTPDSQLVYQRKYCGASGTASFIIRPDSNTASGYLFEVAGLKWQYTQSESSIEITLINSPKNKLILDTNSTWFIFTRWSQELNIVEMSAAKYVVNENIPIYKRQSQHYYYDIDNRITSTATYNIEMIQDKEEDVMINGFYGKITDIKLIDIYVDNISEILQMYPTNNHMLINDTARKFVNLNGANISG